MQSFHTVWPLFHFTYVKPLKFMPVSNSENFMLPSWSSGCCGCLSCMDWPYLQQFLVCVSDVKIVNFPKKINDWIELAVLDRNVWENVVVICRQIPLWVKLNPCIAGHNFMRQCSVAFNNNEIIESKDAFWCLGLVLWFFPCCCVILIQKKYRSQSHKKKNN